MTDVSTRINSFENWPVSFIEKNDLANNGFVYTGNEDHVQCVYCKMMIGMWEEGDDPYQEHRRLSPNCPFFNSPEEYETDACGVSNGDTAAKYTTYESRLESFKGWPETLKQRPEELAEAGFYYFGTDDKAMCFSCQIGLHEWKVTDDPWEEHALWSPQCEFLRKNKDSSFIERVLEENFAKKSKVNETRSAAFETSTGEESGTLCGICLTGEKSIVFEPCRHMYACGDCASKVNACPICRRPITRRMKVYLA